MGPVGASRLRVGAVALTDLVSAGIERLLLPFSDRVGFAREGVLGYDVGLIDPDLLAPRWHPPGGVPLVAVTRDGSPGSAERAEELGAGVVVGPDARAVDLLESIEEAHRRSGRPTGVTVGALTPRENDVIALICGGSSNAEIAASLYISPNSVKTYIRTAYRKMGVHTRPQAVLWCLSRGLQREPR